MLNCMTASTIVSFCVCEKLACSCLCMLLSPGNSLKMWHSPTLNCRRSCAISDSICFVTKWQPRFTADSLTSRCTQVMLSLCVGVVWWQQEQQEQKVFVCWSSRAEVCQGRVLYTPTTFEMFSRYVGVFSSGRGRLVFAF